MRTAPCVGIFWLLAATAVCAEEPKPYRIEYFRERDASRVTVAARDGVVRWRDVLQGLAVAERLDEESLAGMLPDGDMRLGHIGTRLSLLTINLAFDGGAHFAIQRDDRDRPVALVIELNREKLARDVRRLKREVRQVVHQWRGGEERYQLQLDQDWRTSTKRPLVLIVHGYSSRPESFRGIRQELRDAGLSTAAFRYPNDGALRESGVQLAAALEELRSQAPDRRVQLLCHSMGGLVARTALELEPPERTRLVARLVMVGTPNQGTNLARIPISMDAWEAIVNRDDSQLTDFVLDGLNEARDDLRPASPFLKKLNQAERRPGVEYSLLLGSKAPLTEERLAKLRADWLRTQQEHRLLRALGPRFGEYLKDLDELVDGKGDGVVAVKRGRLAGVEDTTVMAFDHFSMTDELGGHSHELSAWVVARVNRE